MKPGADAAIALDCVLRVLPETHPSCTHTTSTTRQSGGSLTAMIQAFVDEEGAEIGTTRTLREDHPLLPACQFYNDEPIDARDETRTSRCVCSSRARLVPTCCSFGASVPLRVAEVYATRVRSAKKTTAAAEAGAPGLEATA